MALDKYRAATAALTGAPVPSPSTTNADVENASPVKVTKSDHYPPPGAADPDLALAWCRAHFNGGPCPADGRNDWLTAFALFCNDKGVPENALLDFALSHPPLAGHDKPEHPRRIEKTIRGNYERHRAKHNANPYTAPTLRGNRSAQAPRPAPMPGGQTPTATPAATADTGRWLPRLLAIETALQATTRETIRFAEPLVRQDGEGVIWPGTIVLLQGQAGAHKSRLAELLATVLLAHPNAPDADTLGLTFHPEPGTAYRFCYVDTERNLSDQLAAALQRIQTRAGYPDGPPPSLRYTSLLTVPRKERFDALREFLQAARAGFDGRLIVWLDVLTDCCENFNDERASLQVFDLLNTLSNDERATFVALIHENPGSLKARGHLGTEGTNKASTVLHVGYVKQPDGELSDVVELRYIKRRDGAPGLTFHAEYDPDARGLVRADPATVAALTEGRGHKAPVVDIIALLLELLAEPCEAGKLAERLAVRLDASNKTIRNRLAVLVDGGAGIPNADGELCHLRKRKQGKATFYYLAPVTPPA